MTARLRVVLWLIAAAVFVASGFAIDVGMLHAARAMRVAAVALAVASVADVIAAFVLANL